MRRRNETTLANSKDRHNLSVKSNPRRIRELTITISRKERGRLIRKYVSEITEKLKIFTTKEVKKFLECKGIRLSEKRVWAYLHELHTQGILFKIKGFRGFWFYAGEGKRLVDIIDGSLDKILVDWEEVSNVHGLRFNPLIPREVGREVWEVYRGWLQDKKQIKSENIEIKRNEKNLIFVKIKSTSRPWIIQVSSHGDVSIYLAKDAAYPVDSDGHQLEKDLLHIWTHLSRILAYTPFKSYEIKPVEDWLLIRFDLALDSSSRISIEGPLSIRRSYKLFIEKREESLYLRKRDRRLRQETRYDLRAGISFKHMKPILFKSKLITKDRKPILICQAIALTCYPSLTEQIMKTQKILQEFLGEFMKPFRIIQEHIEKTSKLLKELFYCEFPNYLASNTTP